jgi:hypothetical protein
LRQFQDEFHGKVDSKFTSLIGAHGEADWWLPDSQPAIRVSEHRQDLDSYFSAYRHLRIKHQLDYAYYKLQSDHRIFSAMPLRQAEVLENVSKAGIAWLFLMHVSVLLLIGVVLLGIVVSDPARVVSVLFNVAIVVIGIAALSARAFQQGLQPEREVERYQQYRSAVQSILDQFDQANTPAQKIEVMRQMERRSFDEMRNFLLTHKRSSFAM